MPVIVLAGEEELLMSERLQSLKDELLDPSWVSFNYSTVLRPDLKQVVDSAAALPFGPGNKLIVFEQCELFSKKRGGDSEEEQQVKSKSKSEKTLDDLEKGLISVSPNTYLVFVCTAKFDKGLKVSKIFEKHAQIENFDKIKFYSGQDNFKMRNWCGNRARKCGAATIDDDAVDYLAESSEGDLRQIAMEIEKAALYVLPAKRISLEVVSKLSPHYSNVFALLDYWLRGDREQVLASLQELMDRQYPATKIVATIQSVLSKWIKIKTAAERVIASLPAGRGMRREIPVSDMARHVQQHLKMDPFMLKKDLERIHKTSLEYLVEKKKELTRLEYSMKSGGLDGISALSIFFSN